MQRKYSEVVNYIPDFSTRQLRNNNQEFNKNQKLSPAQIYRPNHSPTVFANPSYQQFFPPNQFPVENNANRNTSFQVGERRSLPIFNNNFTGVQTINPILIDPRNQNNNGFRNNGLMNQNTYARRAGNHNFSSEPIQQFNSPQNLVRSHKLEIVPTQEDKGLKKNVIITKTSPSKVQPAEKINQVPTLYENIPRPPLEFKTLSIPASRENGRITQSMFISDLNAVPKKLISPPNLAGQSYSPLNLNNSLSNSSDLESTFSSDNNNSCVDLSSSVPDPIIKFRRPEIRKKQQVWKSMEIGMLQNTLSQNSNQAILTENTNILESIKQKQENSHKERRNTMETAKIEQKQITPPPVIKKASQEEITKSGQLKFRKKVDHNPTNCILDIAQLSKIKQAKQMKPKKFTLDDFHIQQKLGRGAYGEVWLAREKKTTFLCVLKALSKKKIKQLKIEQLVFREIKIQTYLVHRHITSLYGVFDDQKTIYLIMECMPDGSMSSNGKRKISQSQTAHLVLQVCEGLNFMHREDIIHRDIKPQNLLLNNAYLKIGDFGCAVFGNTLRRTIVGCYAYISPEQFSNNPYDEKIDSWSVGILAYQLLTGKPPHEQKLKKMAQSQVFEEINGQENIEAAKIKFSQLSFPKELKLSNDAIDFIKRLLDPDPATRADIKQALKHRFLQKSKQYQKILESKL